MVQRLWTFFIVLTASFVPMTVEAQTTTDERVIVAKSLQELQPLLKTGVAVVVREPTGETIRGKLTGLYPKPSAALSKRPLSFPDEPLVAFWANDRLLNGAVDGALAGVVAALVTTAGCGCQENAGDDVKIFFQVSLLEVPIGAGVGAIVDGLFRHQELHVEYARKAPKAKVSILPSVQRSNASVSVSLRF
jgi:hypothetical protein